MRSDEPELRQVGCYHPVRSERESRLGETAVQLGVLRERATPVAEERLPQCWIFPADIRQPDRHAESGYHAGRLRPVLYYCADRPSAGVYQRQADLRPL